MKVDAHLEHHQVVVVPLYLQDAGQSHHSCFEIWRITWKRGKRAMMSSFAWGGSMKTSKRRKKKIPRKQRARADGEEGSVLTVKVDEGVHCLGVTGGCQRFAFPVLLH